MSADPRAIALVMTLRKHGIGDKVLSAIERTPREAFVDEPFETSAYDNTALPIACGQTISQPFIVAYATEQLALAPNMRVLEIGTGSGYQAAVLAALVETIYTVERIEELLRAARRRFRNLKLENIRTRHDDGNTGWPAEAPFDAIVLTAAGEAVPRKLLDQLSSEGVLVAPLGPPGKQKLTRMRKQDNEWVRDELEEVSFVPLLGGVT